VASDGGGIPHITKKAVLERQLSFGKYMTEKRFDQIVRAFTPPFYKKSNPKWGGAARRHIKFDRPLHCRCYLDDLKVAWIKAIDPGGLVALRWEYGSWSIHGGLAWLEHLDAWVEGHQEEESKPHPFGLGFKTVCCGVTGVVINFEAQEASYKDIMKGYGYVAGIKKSSACGAGGSVSPGSTPAGHWLLMLHLGK
jgi:hypothetical protein